MSFGVQVLGLYSRGVGVQRVQDGSLQPLLGASMRAHAFWEGVEEPTLDPKP